MLTMKMLIPILLLTLSQLKAEIIAYEGLSNSTRTGWDSPWRIIEGDAEIVRDSLSITNFKDSEGSIKIERDSGVICDIKTPLQGKFYGSYRSSCNNLVEDSLISLVIQKSGADLVNVKDASLSISLKGWKLDHGSLTVHGNSIKLAEHSPIENSLTYLLLWKVENITDINTPYSTIEAWTLNAKQATYFASTSLNEATLSNAPIGSAFNQVTQRVRHRTNNGKMINFADGISVGLISRFGPDAVFDEIVISNESLAEAALVTNTQSSLIEQQ